MDQKSLELLEFPRIREILSRYTEFSAGSRLALTVRPLSDYGQVNRLLNQSREARRLIALNPNFSIGQVADISDIAHQAELGMILQPLELLRGADTLASLRELRKALHDLRGDFPLLWELAKEIIELPEIEKAIKRCLRASGEILDTASPTLANLRQQLKVARRNVLDQLGNIINSPRLRNVLQEELITERYGRYVIPIKVESRHRVKGIVHDISNTGATVYLEPAATIDAGNELRELEIAEEHEVARILQVLSGKIGERFEDISRSIEFVAELDFALAKGRYAASADAIEPEIIVSMMTGEQTSGTWELRLIGARHPLLGKDAVPLTLDIGNDFSTLVITGPNMGGKTVTLKTIGLLSLMALAGIPIPASEESKIPMFDNVYSDIGDEQNIEQTVSTFSWHIGNIVRFTKSVTERSLVLVDELGTSTDPAEGSALARSILRYLLDRGVITVATTHHNDLKAFAYVTAGMQNASLDFDPIDQKPTYRLRVGIPGGSNALATALRLGISPEIAEEAKRLLSTGDQELQSLLDHLRGERESLSQLRSNLEKEREELEKKQQELQSGVERLETDRLTIIRETRDRVLTEAADLHKEIKHAISELRRQKSEEKVEQAHNSIATVRQRLNSEPWVPEMAKDGDTEQAGVSIAPGDTVLVKELNVRGKVLSVFEAAHEVELQAGQSRVRLSLDSVTKETSVSEEATSTSSTQTGVPNMRPVSIELDLRGKRAHEVDALLDSYLNDASVAGLRTVRIIHGFGTGTMRNVVRDLLATHPLVVSFRAGKRDEGGDGVTVVDL
jgi:DNA mismatch repair protein MutS2